MKAGSKSPTQTQKGQTKSYAQIKKFSMDDTRPLSKNNLLMQSVNHIRTTSFKASTGPTVQRDIESKMNMNRSSSKFRSNQQLSTGVYFKGGNQTKSNMQFSPSKLIQQLKYQTQTLDQLHLAIDEKTSPASNIQYQNQSNDSRLIKLVPIKLKQELQTGKQKQNYQTDTESPLKRRILDKKPLNIFNGQSQVPSTNNSRSHSIRQTSISQNQPPNQESLESVFAKTQPGKNPDKTTKINQDISFYFESFHGRSLFCVCDGHGSEGHKASQFIRDTLPKQISLTFNSCTTIPKYKECLVNGFKLTNLLLNEQSDIDCTFSGSTCVLVLIVGNTLITANIGDSRAIICKQVSTAGTIQGVPLSNDHKPDNPIEQRRIEMRGGRVQPYLDYDGTPVGPARVWMKDADIPGLAMSRSFGDKVASQCGVTAEPEITTYELSEQDKFLVLASDGVWEFLSNQQVAEIMYPFYIRKQGDLGCAKLIKESTALWRENDEVIDDITCILVNLKRSN